LADDRHHRHYHPSDDGDADRNDEAWCTVGILGDQRMRGCHRDGHHRHRCWAAGGIALIAAVLVGCADDPADARVQTAERAAPPLGTIATTTTTATEPDAPVPPGLLVAVPQQNREDPAKGQFQLQLVNGTDARFAVRSVQFRWTGFSSPVTPRDSQIVGGQTIDFPVPFPGATCVGDGTIDAMPSLDGARVLLGLDDGGLLEVPVIDRWHLARRLYLEDCQRQSVATSVTVEWADLRRAQHQGRPVTEGVLRLTRGTGTATIRIESVSGTIPYGVETIGVAQGETVVVLPSGEDTADARIRFVESRCDPHALAEVKQPHEFVAQVDLGDGVLVPFIVVPPETDWVPMRLTVDEACAVTGQVVFVGDDADASTP